MIQKAQKTIYGIVPPVFKGRDKRGVGESEPSNLPATLLLEDGSTFHGTSFGADVSTDGEVVFNTSMIGYPEALTDPSYRGQILTFTYPLIGNYGIPAETKDKDNLKENFESDQIHIRGLIVSEYSANYNHWQSKQSLHDWMKKYNIPGLSGIDTRALTQKIREKGAMLGKIIINGVRRDAPMARLYETSFWDPNKENLVAEVSPKEPITYHRGRTKIALVDTGMKYNILRNYLKRNITVHRVPWNYDPFSGNLKFDGICFANGPGDPSIVKATHAIMQKALNKKIPTFGICLGIQVMAHAAGGQTFKLKYGHRGQNQPCIDLETKRCYITSQNHGFAVDPKSLNSDWDIWFANLNDHTVEGIKHKTLPFFAVQFHPESTPGPNDTEFLFDQFLKLL